MQYISVSDSDKKNNFKNSFPVPTFNPKKNKKKKTEDVQSVSVVDNILDVLQKKSDEKKEKEQQILLNKQERERVKVMKEKEQNIIKQYNESKKKKQQEKKDIKGELQKLKKQIKSGTDKENMIQLKEQQQKLDDQLIEINNLSVLEEMEFLKSKIKIKEEKI